MAGTPVSGTTEGAFDQASSSCGDGAHGPDTVYSLQIAQRSRVRVTLHSDDFTPVVHLRARCEDPHSLIACADSSENDHEAEYLGVLDAGSYAVFADSAQREASGKYNLQAETTSETGAGTRGDRCADAIPVSASEHEVAGDTFLARDDLTTQCGGAGAPDVFYRIDVPARARLTAHLTRGEESHVLALLRGCGPGKVELGCGKNLDRAVGPGSYYIAVDGDSPTAFGAFTFAWGTHETRAQEAACRAPQALQDGQPVNGTTFGAATDKFTPTCVSVDTAAGAGAPDAVYKLVVASRRRVRLKLRTPGWDGVLSVRKACVEGESPAVSAGEVECKADSSNNGEIDFDSVLEAGTYFVIVDGRTPSSAGPFTIELQQ